MFRLLIIFAFVINPLFAFIFSSSNCGQQPSSTCVCPSPIASYCLPVTIAPPYCPPPPDCPPPPICPPPPTCPTQPPTVIFPTTAPQSLPTTTTTITITQPTTTTTTITQPTTTQCGTACSILQLNPRQDALTIITTYIQNSCLIAQFQCRGDSITTTFNYLIAYSDNIANEIAYNTTYASPPLLICGRAGTWLDPTNGNKSTLELFCFEVINSAGCSSCDARRTSPPIQTHPSILPLYINMPIYNRTSASPDYCCDASSSGVGSTFQSGPSYNYSTSFATLHTQSHPRFTGLIGTANCSNSLIANRLCLCGHLAVDDTTRCWHGDAHLYLIDGCDSTGNNCMVYAMPFTNALDAVTIGGDAGGNRLLLPDFADPSLIDIYPAIYPSISLLTCVSNGRVGRIECGNYCTQFGC